MQCISIESYLEAIERWNSTRGKVVNGKGYYLVNGEWIPDKMYFQHNTKPYYIQQPKINPNGTYVK
jgi:hypothetical protein